MVKRFATLALILSLTPVPTFAQTLGAAVSAGGAGLAAGQQSATRGTNPYKTPAIVLMGAGVGLTILALAGPTSVCADASTSAGCGKHYNKGVLFGGLGTLSFGIFLYMKGETRRRTIIQPIPGGVLVGKRIRY